MYASPYPPIRIPETDLLSYLFPPSKAPSSKKVWINAADPSESLSPAELLSYVRRLGRYLDSLAIPRGAPVLVHSPNHIFVPVAYLAIVGSGRIFTGANPAYTAKEVAHQIRDTSASLILAHPSIAATTREAVREASLPDCRIILFSGRRTGTIDGLKDWRDVVPSMLESAEWRWPVLSHEAATTIATVNYSSGTTGLPKGVCITHKNLIANLEQNIVSKYAGTPYHAHSHSEERWLGVLPLYHAYGQLWTILMAPRLEIPVFVMERFVFVDFLASIQRHRITHLHVAPPMLVMLAKRPETQHYDLSSVTDCLCGGAPLSGELQNEISSRFDMNVTQGWGMTELTCGAIHVPGGERNNTGSIGALVPNFEAVLVDESGAEVPDGPGELLVRGPNVCLGYWRNEAATRDLFTHLPSARSSTRASPDDGRPWMRTGDVALHSNGQFWIVDRQKELIKVNALQVSPAELEAVLLEHPRVADAAVVGVRVGEDEWPLGYVVVRKPAVARIGGEADDDDGAVTEQAVQAWVAGRVAKHKRLVGGVVFVDEIPKLPSGKITRKIVREWARKHAERLEEAGGKARL